MRVFPRPLPMKYHLQIWRHFHKLFHVVRFQQCIPFSMYECTRTGWSVCYCYMVAIHVSWTQRGFLWPYVSGINLSPVHSAFKFTDLYYPMIPSHSCQRLKKTLNTESAWPSSRLHPAATGDGRGFLNHWSVLLWIMVTCRNRRCIPSFKNWCLRLGCPWLHVRVGNSVDMYLSISQLPYPISSSSS